MVINVLNFLTPSFEITGSFIIAARSILEFDNRKFAEEKTVKSKQQNKIDELSSILFNINWVNQTQLIRFRAEIIH